MRSRTHSQLTTAESMRVCSRSFLFYNDLQAILLPSIFGTTLVALSSLQPHASSLWSFTCFRICCSQLCTLTFVLLSVSSHTCAFICVLLLSFHVMPCSICSSLHYLGSLAGVISMYVRTFYPQKPCFHGTSCAQIGARTNGRHILFFEFRILDEKLEVGPGTRASSILTSEDVHQP